MPHMTPRPADHPAFELTIRRLFEAPVVDHPEEEIVYRGQVRLTYRQFRERVHRLAGALTALGVKAGDTVAVMDYDSHRYLEAFFAVPMMGAVLHTVNVRLSPEQIAYTIDHAEDDVILVHADFLPILEAIRGKTEHAGRLVVLVDDAQPATSLSVAGEYEALLAAAPARFEFPDLDEGTRATTFYTTGTTGHPKGVYFSHRQLVLHTLGVTTALATARHCTFRQGDVYLPITPMFHVHAWGIPYVATALGVKQVYPGRASPDTLLSLIDREKVTFSHCVPTLLHMLLKAPGAEKVDLSRWKVLIGGAAMPKALAQAALARGIDVAAGYGMSETCPVLSVAFLDEADLAQPPEAQAELRCRTGRTLPLVQIRIADEQGAEQPRDGRATGEIQVRAPWLTQGYLKDVKASDRLWAGGWLHTGDVAWRDGRGYVKITDRMKDVVKVGGEWLSSLEVEDALLAFPGVGEVAVIGMPDAKWGEKPLALVVPKPEAAGKLTERELTRHLSDLAHRGALNKQVVVAVVKFVEAIDRTSVGKVNKVALRTKHLG